MVAGAGAGEDLSAGADPDDSRVSSPSTREPERYGVVAAGSITAAGAVWGFFWGRKGWVASRGDLRVSASAGGRRCSTAARVSEDIAGGNPW